MTKSNPDKFRPEDTEPGDSPSEKAGEFHQTPLDVDNPVTGDDEGKSLPTARDVANEDPSAHVGEATLKCPRSGDVMDEHVFTLPNPSEADKERLSARWGFECPNPDCGQPVIESEGPVGPVPDGVPNPGAHTS